MEKWIGQLTTRPKSKVSSQGAIHCVHVSCILANVHLLPSKRRVPSLRSRAVFHYPSRRSMVYHLSTKYTSPQTHTTTAQIQRSSNAIPERPTLHQLLMLRCLIGLVLLNLALADLNQSADPREHDKHRDGRSSHAHYECRDVLLSLTSICAKVGEIC